MLSADTKKEEAGLSFLANEAETTNYWICGLRSATPENKVCNHNANHPLLLDLFHLGLT